MKKKLMVKTILVLLGTILIGCSNMDLNSNKEISETIIKEKEQKKSEPSFRDKLKESEKKIRTRYDF